MLPDPAPSNDLYVVTSVSVKEKLMTYSESDIAIVGMNCQYPGVHSVAAFETVLRTGCNILDPKSDPEQRPQSHYAEQRL